MWGFKSKTISSFAALNVTQFLAALNDNLYKLLLIFFLISLKGSESSNTILAIAGVVFVIPFLLFAALAGILADRFSKRTVIYFTRLLEIVSTSLGAFAFSQNSVLGGYITLFLMATHSALFSPCKYGIIPEIVRPERVSNCNGIMTATTYLAIILGTFLASFLTEITHKNFVFSASICIVIACVGTCSSFWIEKTTPQAREKKVSARFLYVIYQTLKKAKRKRYLLVTIIFGAYFLFLGAYTQLNIIPFALQSLHLSEVEGGYLFLMTAIGIGLGAFLAGRFSQGDVELGFVPLAACGVMGSFILLYIFDTHFFIVAPLLMLVGFFGGFFVVPIDSFIQIASPDADRGQNVAAANFMSFLGVVLASLFVALFGNGFQMSAAEGFLTIGILSFIIGFFLLLVYIDQVLRLFVTILAKLFCTIEVYGKENLHKGQAILLVAPRISFMDTLLVMATLPRLIRYIIPVEKEQKKRSLIYQMLRFIPLDVEHFSSLGPKAFKAVEKELATGNSVCWMHPVEFPSSTLEEWESKLDTLLKNLNVPLMPIHIRRRRPSTTNKRLLLKSLISKKIVIRYGTIQKQ